jgi:NAD(P)-dependent dehydrogenase (short-subunit alcohol dehydrogenase family)
MQLNINDRVALVTGASQGIGREIAIQLAKEGARVAITSNDQKNLEQVANEIQALGGAVTFISANAVLESDIKQCVKHVTSQFGSIDILVNNVGGIGRVAQFEEIHAKEWYEVFDLNVMSGVNFTKFALPVMKKKQWGRVVFVSSEKATEPGTCMSHYALSKAALLSLAKSLANEVGKEGITVNSVSPGVIVTPAWDESARQMGLSREECAAKFNRSVLTDAAFGKPEDVASLVCYLCSEAAHWVTGSNFRVDGGSLKNIQM